MYSDEKTYSDKSTTENIDTDTPESSNQGEYPILFFYSIAGITMTLILVFATTNVFETSYQYLRELLSTQSETQALVNYYQWNRKNGEVVVSREPPEPGVSYITFQASSDLFRNENQKDQKLIKREKAFLQEKNDNAFHNEQPQELVSASTDSAKVSQPMSTKPQREYCAELEQGILRLEQSRKYRTRYEDMHRDSDELRRLRDLKFRSCR